MKGRSASSSSSSTLLLLLNAFWHESPSQRERGRESDTESHRERSDNDFLLHRRIWMCPSPSRSISSCLRTRAPTRNAVTSVRQSGRHPSICPARTGGMNNGPRTIVTNLFCSVFSRARNIPSSELLAMDEEQTVNNNSGIVFYDNSDEVFSFFSALPEMQSHRQLTHLGMGVRGAVCTRELLQEERERE